MTVTITAIQWKYSKRMDNTSPIKIRVTYNTDSKYFPIQHDGKAVSLTKENWNEIETNPKVKGELRAIRDTVRKEETEARKIVEAITAGGKRSFSFAKFEHEYKVGKPKSFAQFFELYLNDLREKNRVGTYNSYSGVYNIFKGFIGSDIPCHEISPTLLQGFEKYLLLERSAKKNTVAIYMRTLRAIFNYAISCDPTLTEFYPFARTRNALGKYQIRTGAGKKGQALSLEDIRSFARLQFKEGSPEWEAKSYWMLSFLCQGMNFRDIALLKVSNVKDELITYVRSKTANSEIDEEPIIVPLTDETKQLISALRTGQKPNDYLFPILNDDLDSFAIVKKAKQKTKVTNEWLKKICSKNNLPSITTYWARHSYATLLRKQGTPVDLIREFLGHSSTKTTESYLGRLETSRSATINKALQETVLQTLTEHTN